jgi:hypothetical protein
MSELELFMPPSFIINEADTSGMGETKEGQRVRVILSYKVIEKTKSYMVLRIKNVYLYPTRRIL